MGIHLRPQGGLPPKKLDHPSIRGLVCKSTEVHGTLGTGGSLYRNCKAKLLHRVRTASALHAYCARRGRDAHLRILDTCLVANRMKGRAVVILSVDATHLLMASEESDVVGMKAVPQTPQGPRRLTCVFYEQSAKYSISAADTQLYDHIPGSV